MQWKSHQEKARLEVNWVKANSSFVSLVEPCSHSNGFATVQIGLQRETRGWTAKRFAARCWDAVWLAVSVHVESVVQNF